MQTSSETSRIGRPRTPRLSRKAIGRAALEMLENEGSISIPRLAESLGVRQSSFYKHVTGRQEIIELARGALVDRVPPPQLSADSLEGVIRETFDALRTAYRQVPALLPLMLTQPVSHPAALELYDRFAAAFQLAGTPAHLIIPALESIDSAAIGATLDAYTMEAAWDIPDADRTQYPHLAAAQAAVAAKHVDRFAFLADVLAAGLRATIDGT
jgi:AcrR family transcriptional regulator